jgi:hypothetical protein
MAAHLVRSQPNDDGDVFVVNTSNYMVEIKHSDPSRERTIYEYDELTVDNNQTKESTYHPSAELLTELIPKTMISSYTDEDPDDGCTYYINLEGATDTNLTVTFTAVPYEPKYYDANLEVLPDPSALSLIRECQSTVAGAHKRLEGTD